MDLSYPPEVEAFRAEVRSWIERNLTPEVVEVADARDALATARPLLQGWARTLSDAGYATAGWPAAHGGRDATVLELVVLTEELERAGAPLHPNILGLQNIAPAIMEWGTPQQQERFLGPMARAEEIWCQGFSEPDAGSDLASLSTRAVLDGDAYVVDGQKVWTSGGHHADWCELLVRTDPDVPKHQGITCLLVPMSLPGIEARPITTISGGQDFAEVFFQGVRVPVEHRLGPESQGWRVAMTTLAHERAGVASLYLRIRRSFTTLLADARKAGVERDPHVRQVLADLHSRATVLELVAKRTLSSPVPGPEGSIIKIMWSELEQAITEAASDVLGLQALDGRWAQDLLDARSMTIAGGTSQVNRNIVAERVLGLPKG